MGDPNPCAPLLANGLYTTLSITKTGDFLYDLKMRWFNFSREKTLCKMRG